MIVDLLKSQQFYFKRYRNRWIGLIIGSLLILWGFSSVDLPRYPAVVALGFFTPFFLIIQGLRYHHLYTRWLSCNENWGTIVSNSRAFARQLLTLISVHTSKKVNVFDINAFQVEGIHRQIALVYIMGYWLRGQLNRIGETVILVPNGELDKIRKQDNIPVGMLQRQLNRLQDARDMGMLDDSKYLRIETTLLELADAFEYCEKSKRTVYPGQITLLARVISLFILILSFVYFSETWLGWICALLVGMIVFYIETVNHDLENPFSNTENDVPVTYLSRLVEHDLKSLLGEDSVGRQVQAIEGILY